MTSSAIDDVTSPVLMALYDSVQVDMIQHTPIYDPTKSYLIWDIFELLWTYSLIQGVFQQQFTQPLCYREFHLAQRA